MSARIIINNNGSIKVEGEIELYDGAGGKYELGDKKAIFLCRCGASNNKPFCDGSHKVCSFQSQVVAFDLTAPKPAA